MTLFCVSVSGYIFVEQPKTFLQAVAHCRAANMELLAIRTTEQVQSTIKTMESVGAKTSWIGITRLHIDSDQKPWDWRYTRNNGKLLRDDFWMAGEPNNLNNNEKCVEFVVIGQNYDTSNIKRFNDGDCALKRPFICEP